MSGFYIDISKLHSSKVPEHYVRKQTLKSSERYTIEPLKSLEEKVLSANSRALEIEQELFNSLVKDLSSHLSSFKFISDVIAKIDILVGFASIANNRNYCKPHLVDQPIIQIDNGRHPVLDIKLDDFVPNSTLLNPDNRLHIITGPNMGGKSTYMRQVALINIMALCGCYVPANNAVIGPIDQIFTRIGAGDDIAEGKSTFMVEMQETANILNNATRNSLVILDEIGRGTSTYDGLSLAWATCEHLLNRLGAMTLFATHYFEMTEIEKNNGAKNYHMAAQNHNDKIIFMHKIEEGATNKSYGIQVAKLAGIPSTVVNQASQQLSKLQNTPHSVEPESQPEQQDNSSIFLKELESLSIDEITPLQAHAYLSNLINRVTENTL